MPWALAFVQHLVTHLEDENAPSTLQLLSCGQENFDRLRRAAQNLATGTSIHYSCEQLDTVIDMSYGKMSSTPPGSFLTCWRRLYTDACILRSLANLLRSSAAVASSSAIDSISRLDRAIIIAGAAGEGRLELIHSIIEKIQSQYLPPCPFEGYPIPPPSPKPAHELLKLQTSFNGIPCLASPPSFTSFQTQFLHHPFILRQFARDWPAMHDHPWSSVDYLRSVAGPGRTIPVEVGKDYRTDDWTQKLMNWDEFLSSLDLPGQSRAQPHTEIWYLAQHNLLMQFPALRADIIVPDYVYTCPPPTDFPGYGTPGNEEQLVINAWLGAKGTISPAHTDPYFNCYVQVVGHKTVWLAPPDMLPSMYPYPPSSTSATGDQPHNPAANTTNPSMSNTSRVDVFSTNDAHLQNYPDFWEHVVPNAISATLEQGDLLYFPPGWWHAMRSEDTSFSVSMWF